MDTELLERLFAEESARPLGAVRLDSAMRRVAELARHQGGRNLMAKAVRAAVAGDDARIRRYALLVAGLPYDEHEERRPGWSHASCGVFEAVTDALEASELDDASWLDAAESVLVDADATAALALRSVLGSLLTEYELPAAERRRCRLTAQGLRSDVWDAAEPADDVNRLAGVESVIRLIAAYRVLVGDLD